MGKLAKISVIPKEGNDQFPTQETSLRKHGHSRFPSTGRLVFPYKETDGRYRTGLDENARYLENLPDGEIKKAEKKRILELRKDLEEKLGCSLATNASFYKTHIPPVNDEPKTTGYKLVDRDMIFDLENPIQAATFAWLSVHPIIASSLEAFNRGDFPPDTQFYVNDNNYEATMKYAKVKAKNDAAEKLNSMSLEKRKKVGRLLDLPINDDTIEEVVYNMIDTFIRQNEVGSGIHKGNDPLRIFNMYVGLNDNTLDIQDLVDQAFKNNIYRLKKGGKVFEGELQVYNSKEELIEHLQDDDNQDDRLALEKKLKFKKLAIA